MIGERSPQQPLFSAQTLYSFALKPGSFHAQLASAAPSLFQDEQFAAFYSRSIGRPSVPPSQLALLTLLQMEAQVSDREVIERSACDLRWTTVLGKEPGQPLCARSTFELFRAHLVLHEGARTIFERSIEEAVKRGLVKKGPLRVALDTKPVLGRGAVEDTYNLLAAGITQLSQCLAKAEGDGWRHWMQEKGFKRYLEPSIKGTAGIDWSSRKERNEFLSGIVKDGRRLLEMASDALERKGARDDDRQRVLAAADLLTKLLLQDIEMKPIQQSQPPATPKRDDRATEAASEAATETEAEIGVASQGEPEADKAEADKAEADKAEADKAEADKAQTPMQATVRDGTAPDRMPSASDPEMRHGRKSKSKCFKGFKASVAVDVDSQVILAVDVLPGNAADATGAVELVEAAERATGERVEKVIGDCAYGGGETREAFAQTDRELVARVPQEAERGMFGKSRFRIDLERSTVTCPAGHTAERFSAACDGAKLFSFGRVCLACPLKSQCTKSKGGRTIRVHPQEEMLQQARAYQATEEGKQDLLDRQAVEHRLGRLGQLGISQARYIGTAKTRLQLLLLAAIANFRLTWNAAAPRPEASKTAQKSGIKGPEEFTEGRFWAILARIAVRWAFLGMICTL